MTEQEIREIIDNNIRTNGREEITGAVANNVLQAMVDYASENITPTFDVSGAISVGQVTTAVNGDKIARYIPSKAISKWDLAYAGSAGGYNIGDVVIHNDEFYVSQANNNTITPSSASIGWRRLDSGGYILPKATTTTLGGIKVGSGLTITPDGVLSAVGGGGGGAYTAGNGIDISADVISVNFGTTSTTATRGDDSRVNNGQTAYTWGNHATQGYIKNNFYTIDGTLSGNRTVGLNGNKLSFNNGITKVDRLELTKLTSNLNPNTLYTDGIDVYLTNEFGVTEKLLRKVDSYEWGRQLTPEDEDITIGSYRGMIVNRKLKIKNFFITASNAPTGSGIIVGMQKNNVTITTINATILANNKTSASNATQPTFSDDTFEIGDEIRFFIPAGGIGSVNAGQNLEVYLEFEKL